MVESTILPKKVKLIITSKIYGGRRYHMEVGMTTVAGMPSLLAMYPIE